VQVSVDAETGELHGCLFDGGASNPAPTCAARGLCDEPGFTEGVGAVEGSICPVCGTGASSSAIAQDLDGDRIGNSCDDEDAVFSMQRATVHANTGRTRPNGYISSGGTVQLVGPTDVFNASSGVVIRVTDGVSLDRAFTFSAGECRRRASGFTSCRSADGLSRISIAPHRKPAGFRYAFAFRRLDMAAPFKPPLTVRLTTDPAVPIDGIDRTGVIAACTLSSHGIRCHIP